MPIPALPVARALTLDHLVALCDEIGALSRAGVPLDRGLKELASDLPGRLGALAGEIAQRLEKGETLSKVLAQQHVQFPPAYRAVIDAGLRVDRLPAALEGVSHTARRIHHLRMMLGTALLYPLAVLLLAWQLLVFTLSRIIPVMMRIMVDIDPALGRWEAAAQSLSQWIGNWGWIFPLAIVAWVAWAWYHSSLAGASMWLPSFLDWGAVRSLRRMQRAGRLAAMSDLLALLIAHDVPLPEAVSLASEASGSPQLAAGGRELAERIRRGEIPERPPAGFSPLLAWTLTSGRGEKLTLMLRRTAQVYRDEFNRRAQWLTLYLPLIATAVVGGSVVAIYALLSLGPWIVIMRRLADPLNM